MEKNLNFNKLLSKISLTYLIILLISLFLAYPRVLFYPPGIDPAKHWFKVSLEDATLPFFSRFPIEIVIGAISLLFLLSNLITFKKIPRKITLALALFSLSIIGSVIVNGSTTDAILLKFNYLLIPLAIAFAIVRLGIFNESREKTIQMALFALWFINILWSYLSGLPLGICGNKNWYSAIILVTSPWAFFFTYHLFRKLLAKFFCKCNENFVAGALAIITIFPITIYWLIVSQTRAIYLALILYSLSIICLKFQNRNRVLFILGVIVISLSTCWIFKPTLAKAYQEDIRGPLWESTVKMILKSPGIGHGPESFIEKFPYYKNSQHQLRLVAAAITEHPHNQFLHFATEIGLPAAIIWLLVTSALFFIKVRNREGNLAKFGIFILLTLSMFDKTLVMAPTNLLFFLFSGILSAYWIKDFIKFETINKIWLMVFIASYLVLLTPITFWCKNIFSAKEIHREMAILSQQISISELHPQEREEYYLKLYDGYLAAHNLDPQSIEYPYLALHVATELLKDPALAENILPTCLLKSQTYEHLNYLAALTYLQKSLIDEKNSQQLRAEAKKHLNLQLFFHPHHLGSLQHLQETFTKMSERDFTNQINQQINNTLISLFNNNYTKELQKNKTNQWLDLVTEKNKQSVSLSQEIFQGVKGINGIDYLTPFYAQSNGYFTQHNHSLFHLSDSWYWQEIINIHKFTNRKNSLEEGLKTLTAALEIQKNQDFLWPSEVLNTRKGNALSIASLVSLWARENGSLAIILRVNTSNGVEWLVLLKNEQEEFIFAPKSKTFLKVKIQDFLNKNDLAEKFLGTKLKSRQFYLFEFPQAFCFRNSLLSKFVSHNSEKIYDFCLSPSVAKMNLQFYLGNSVSFEYLKEPFHRLEEDILKAK